MKSIKDYKSMTSEEIADYGDWQYEQMKDRRLDDELDRRLTEQTDESYKLLDEEQK